MKLVKIILKKLILIILVIIVIWLVKPTYTTKIKSINSINELRKVEINGTKLSVMIRGNDKNNPVIINVHGGPLASEIPYIKKYQDLLEKDFTIVNYDQRGGGKSYNLFENYDKLNAETNVNDLIELTLYIKKYLNKDKVILMAHSYGTYLGMMAINKKPKDYLTYIGIGQVADTKVSEMQALEDTLILAKRANNQKDIKSLEAIKEDVEKGKSFVSRKILRKYGYTARNIAETSDYIKGFLFSTEYNGLDYLKFELGLLNNSNKLLPEILDKPLTQIVQKVDIPVYFVMGKYDRMTSPDVAQKYLESLDVDGTKKFILYDNSGHYPQFEEKENFYNFMIDNFK